jgi:hypothetical protein
MQKQKVGEPIGAPRTRRPSHTSTGTRSPWTILEEYLEIVCCKRVPFMMEFCKTLCEFEDKYYQVHYLSKIFRYTF